MITKIVVKQLTKIRDIYLYTICAIMIQTRTVIRQPETIPKIACVERKSENENETIHKQQIRFATEVTRRNKIK